MNLKQVPARHGPLLNFQGLNKPSVARCESPIEAARKQATPKRSRLAVSDGGAESKQLLGADDGEVSSRPVSAAGQVQVHLPPRTQSESQSQSHRSLEMLYDARCDSVFEHERELARCSCGCKQHQRSDCSRASVARFKSHSSSTLRQQQRSDTTTTATAVSARAADCSHLSEGSYPLASTPYRLLGGQRKSSPLPLASHRHSERGSTPCADEHVAHLPPSGPRSQSGSFRSASGSLVHAHDTSSGSFRASNSSAHDDSLGRSSTSRHASGGANPVPLEQCLKCRDVGLVERENDECDCEECSRELPDGEHVGADDGALLLAQTRSMEVHERPSEQRGRSRRRNCFSAHASMEDCSEESDADELQVKSGSDSGNPCDELESSTPQRECVSHRRSFCTQTDQPEQPTPARALHPRTRDASCQMDPSDELAENRSSRGDRSRRTDSSRSRSRSRALSIERGVALLHLSSNDSGNGSEAINSSGDRVRSSTRSSQSGSDSTVKDAAKTHHFSQRLRPIRQRSKQAIVCTLHVF